MDLHQAFESLAQPEAWREIVAKSEFEMEMIEKAHSGIMVCLYLPSDIGKLIEVEGGEPVEKMHITLAYIPGVGNDQAMRDKIANALEPIAADFMEVKGRIGGVGKFNASQSSDGMDVFYASYNSPGLVALRQAVVDALDHEGIDLPSTHGFTPHVTLKYLPVGSELPADRKETADFMIPNLSVVSGDLGREDLLFTGRRVLKMDDDEEDEEQEDIAKGSDENEQKFFQKLLKALYGMFNGPDYIPDNLLPKTVPTPAATHNHQYPYNVPIDPVDTTSPTAEGYLTKAQPGNVHVNSPMGEEDEACAKADEMEICKAAVSPEEGIPFSFGNYFRELFDRILVNKGALKNLTIDPTEDEAMAYQAVLVEKGGPGSGRRPEGGSKKEPEHELDHKSYMEEGGPREGRLPTHQEYMSEGGPRGGKEAQKAFEEKHPYASGYKVHSSGHTKDEALARAKKMRTEGTFASVFHQDGPKSGKNSKYFVVKGAGQKISKEDQVENYLKDHQTIPILKADAQRQLVYGVVLTPEEIDTQDDWMTAEDIEEAAHRYMIKSRVVGSGHSRPMKAEVVESYIAPQDFTFEGQHGSQEVKKGAWVMGVKIHDPSEWQKVLKGDYTGFSVGGFGQRDRTASI